MRSALVTIVIVLLLVAANAMAETIGLYFAHGEMHYSPTMPFELFKGYVISYAVPCDLTAVEFGLGVPTGITVQNFTIPNVALAITQDYTADLSIAFWPALNSGSNLLCTFDLMATETCTEFGGIIQDAPIRIIPSANTGRILYVCYDAVAPHLHDIIGLSSTICPVFIAAQETSWGAIKSLFAE